MKNVSTNVEGYGQHVRRTSTSLNPEQGFTIILVLSLVALLALVLGTYSVLTVNNVRISASSKDGSSGVYAAEASLNARAEKIKQKFVGYRVPIGPSPLTGAGNQPCKSGNNGANDMQCQTLTLAGRTVTSYVKQDATNFVQIPPGEAFAGLSAEETPFTVNGVAYNSKGNPEAIASLAFKSRLVPLFQFAVFFSKDLEFDNTAQLNLSGPVHTNGNLFLDGQLTINGSSSQVSSAGNIYRGVKQSNTACVGTVQIGDATNALQTIACGSGRVQLTSTMTAPFGSKLKGNIPALTVPTVQDLQPVAGNAYWDKADVRVVLKQTGDNWQNDSNWTVNLVQADGTTSALSSLIGECDLSIGRNLTALLSPLTGSSSTFTIASNFRDNREFPVWAGADRANPPTPSRINKRMVDINVQRLLRCIELNPGTLGGINNDTDGGLVVYLTVQDDGPNKSNMARSTPDGNFIANNYGFRLFNGKDLKSTVTNVRPKGLTFISDQAVYIQGDYNSPGVASTNVTPPAFAARATGWVPSSVVSDSVNVLSNTWNSQSICQDSQGYYRSSNLNVANAVSYGGTRTTPPTPYLERIMGQNWYYYNNVSFAATATADQKSQMPLFCRTPGPTTIQAAVLAGSATTGNIEGAVWPNGGAAETTITSGGVHNMMRFHEDWGGVERSGDTVNYNYSGSLVSLSTPLHVRGNFKLGTKPLTDPQDYSPVYRPPTRQWQYDAQFNQASNLPPLTPRFVYIKQENFTRQFSQD